VRRKGAPISRYLREVPAIAGEVIWLPPLCRNSTMAAVALGRGAGALVEAGSCSPSGRHARRAGPRTFRSGRDDG
jgi:hypothetical protein